MVGDEVSKSHVTSMSRLGRSINDFWSSHGMSDQFGQSFIADVNIKQLASKETSMDDDLIKIDEHEILLHLCGSHSAERDPASTIIELTDAATSDQALNTITNGTVIDKTVIWTSDNSPITVAGSLSISSGGTLVTISKKSKSQYFLLQ